MDFQTAINKAERFISYQERSEFEVKQKLYLLEVSGPVQKKVIGELKENGMLNDERFAINFVMGKFRIKKWGRAKIKYALYNKGVNPKYITKAMQSISEVDYAKTIQELFKMKRSDFAEKITIDEKAKISRYLQGKGFEMEFIMPLLQKD